MWTPKAFHVREIPVNNVIYVTDSLAVRQTRQNTSSFFQHTSQSNFFRLRLSIEKIKSEHLGSVNRVMHPSMCASYSGILVKEKYVKIK